MQREPVGALSGRRVLVSGSLNTDVVGFEVVDLDTVRRSRTWFVALGIAFVVLGILAIVLPFAASLVTALVVGWLLIVAGIFQGVHAIQHRRWGGSGWALVGAIVDVIAGGLVVAFPIRGKLALTLVLAVFLAAEGVLKIIRAVQHNTVGSWGWLVFDGILTLALGLLILFGWPSTAVWALGLLVGIDLLFGGFSMLLIAASSARPVAGVPRV
jgi:uncharacterized membrane protein HdeD (DUF308 family)